MDAAAIMDGLFWRQAYGDKEALLRGLTDSKLRQFAEINYGPWDRLAENAPFVPGVGPKPLGAQFYPLDMTLQEFEAANLPESRSEYTVLRRDATGKLKVVPYHVEYADGVGKAAALLEQAAALAEDAGLKSYLAARAKSLRTDDFDSSDRAWLDMKTNRIDFVIGPIETYEDKLFGYKAAYEAYVLVKDMEWSKKLARYSAMLPELQRGLPVPEAYKAEGRAPTPISTPTTCCITPATATRAPRPSRSTCRTTRQIQLEKGTRRLQLKNAMRAKFDKIMVPIANELIGRSSDAT